MRISNSNGFAILRRWRRAICSALLPAFAVWALTTPACFAGVDSTAAQQPVAATHASHAADADMHHAPAHHEHSGAPAATDCPHCPPSNAETAPTVCVVDAGVSASSPPQKGAAAESGHVLVATRFAPLPSNLGVRLRDAAAPDTTRAFAHVPLNIRHCVFLI